MAELTIADVDAPRAGRFPETAVEKAIYLFLNIHERHLQFVTRPLVLGPLNYAPGLFTAVMSLRQDVERLDLFFGELTGIADLESGEAASRRPQL